LVFIPGINDQRTLAPKNAVTPKKKKRKEREKKNQSHKKTVFHSYITPALEQQWLLNPTLILQVNRLLKISKWQL